MAHITATDLVRTFGEKRAVDNVSVTVADGEFFVLVGPSGCGKTTTLRLLAGLEEVESGTIKFGDREVQDLRPKKRNIAMVFQDYAVFPHLTVYENIAYGIRARHYSRSVVNERVPAAAATFRIDHLIRRKPRQLSGGERQRIALARAMVRDADAYLYDEPLSNLDAQLRHQAREDILTLHRSQRKPSIYVTHDQSEAMSMGDRIAVMRAGKIEQVGTGQELYEQPQSLFVAFFLGTPSINIFDARLADRDGKLIAATAAFELQIAPEAARRVRARAGQAIKLGIRPEALHVPNRAPFEVTDRNTIHGIVDVIEPTSSGCAVYMSTTADEPQDFAATFGVRVPSNYLGREIPLAVDTRKLHLFDAATESSLL